MASLTSTNSLPNWVKLSLRWDNQAQFHWPYRNWTTCTRNELASLGQLLSWLMCHAILLDSLGLNEIQVRKEFVPGISASHFFSKCVNWLYSNGLQHHKKCCHCLKRLISFWNKTCPLQRQWKHIIFSCPFIWMQMWPFIQLWPHTGQFQTSNIICYWKHFWLLWKTKRKFRSRLRNYDGCFHWHCNISQYITMLIVNSWQSWIHIVVNKNDLKSTMTTGFFFLT